MNTIPNLAEFDVVTPGQAIGFILVLGFAVVVAYLDFKVAFRFIRRRFAARPGAAGPVNAPRPLIERRWFLRTLAAFTLIGLCLWPYAQFIEPQWIERTHVVMTVNGLKPGAAPIRIVHISDLHFKTETSRERRLPGIVAEMKPDIVVITGDLIEDPGAMPALVKLLKRLKEACPLVLVVSGNLDPGGDRTAALEAGLEPFDGRTRTVEINGNRIAFIGVSDSASPNVEDLGRGVEPGVPRVVLIHRPDDVECVSLSGAEVMLCGHTHGGQVRLPFYGAVITMSRLGKKYEMGRYTVGGTQLYVNRGFGVEGPVGLSPRFLCRPEVALIELVPPEKTVDTK